jgi:hypothetical protein
MAATVFVGRTFPDQKAFLAAAKTAFPHLVDEFIATWRQKYPSDDDETFILSQFNVAHVMSIFNGQLRLLTSDDGDTVYLGLTTNVFPEPHIIEPHGPNLYWPAAERLAASLPTDCPLLPPALVERRMLPFRIPEPCRGYWCDGNDGPEPLHSMCDE